MKVLLVGNGGREHALARTMVRTSTAEHPVSLLVQAGNPGIDLLGTPLHFDPLDAEQVAALAAEHAVALVVVGPEAPLVAGVADALHARRIPCFGPTAAAARLESSKSWAKEIMEAAGVPTAQAHTCRTLDEAAAALDHFGAPHVVKDDALAAGKGVIVTTSLAAALDHAAACLARTGGAVVVEEHLDGPEVSLFCLSDGHDVTPLVPAQDFKRLLDGGEGPNTGGMGAYTPLPWLTPDVVDTVVEQVALPTVRRLEEIGTPFVGLLYCGLAMTSRGVRVIEFNARFGDPETQVVLERLRSPLAPALHAAATGRLASHPPLDWSPDAAVTVVMASAGYPASSHSGDVITGLDEAGALEGVHVLHAGTRREADTGRILTAGGRVLDVVATGVDVPAARRTAYEAVARIHFDGAQHRSDIATWPADLDH